MGYSLGAASAAVKGLQDALRALGTATRDSTLMKLTADGLIGPATAAAMNRAFTAHIGSGQADASLRTGKVTTAVILSKLPLITSIVLREVERRTGAAPGSITVATVASKPPPKSTAAPKTKAPDAVFEEERPSFFSRPGVKIGIGVGASVLVLTVVGVFVAKKKPAAAAMKPAMKPAMAGLGMSKKDYISFASILCNHGASPNLVNDVADYFQQDNPSFARSRFVGATRQCTPIRRAA
jgi:hypothetical protein